MSLSEQPGPAQAAEAPKPPQDLMESLGLRVQLTFPDLIAVTPPPPVVPLEG